MRYIILFLSCMLAAQPALAEKEKAEAPEATEKRKKSLSERLPPIKTGFLVDLDPDGRDGFFYFGFETCSWELFGQHWSADIGVASGRVITGLGLGLWFDGAVGPFVWGGYNIGENAPAWGIGLNMLKL